MMKLLRLPLLVLLFLFAGSCAVSVPPLPGVEPEPGFAGRLAYIEDADLWIMDLPAGPARRVEHRGQASGPRWSPSGEWLSYCAGNLYVIRADGSDNRRLGKCYRSWVPDRDLLLFAGDDDAPRLIDLSSGDEGPAPAFANTWHPDGSTLAFADVDWSEGPPHHQFALYRASLATGETEALFSADPGAMIKPAGWSNTEILFWHIRETADKDVADGMPLYALNPETGQARELLPITLVVPNYFALSPDRQHLAVIAGSLRQTWTNKAIMLIDLAGGEAQRLTDADTAALFPIWSPDGKHLAYVAAPDLGAELRGEDEERPFVVAGMMQRRIWRMNADGSEQQQLTSNQAYRDEGPRWTADGNWIVFVRMNANGVASLWIMRSDGSRQRRITAQLGTADIDGHARLSGMHGLIPWNQFDVSGPVAAP